MLNNENARIQTEISYRANSNLDVIKTQQINPRDILLEVYYFDNPVFADWPHMNWSRIQIDEEFCPKNATAIRLNMVYFFHFSEPCV